MKKLGKSIYLTAMALVLSLMCATTVSAANISGCSPHVTKFSTAVKALTADVKNAGTQQEINGFIDLRLVKAIKLVSDDAKTPINAADRAQLAEVMSDLMVQVTRSLVKFAEAEDKANQITPEMKKMVEDKIVIIRNTIGECAQKSNNMEEFLMQLNNFKM